jgi:lipoprotein signal peptidase
VADESDLERTEPASSRRLEQAREEGRVPQSRELSAFLVLLAGAAGNGLDRWRSGSVVDFLELVPIHFPIFNIADVAINLAVACFLIDLLRSGRSGDRSSHHGGQRDG